MKEKELKSIIKRVIAGILLCVIVFSVAKIVTYFEQMADSNHMQDDIINEVVTPNDSAVSDPADVETDENTEEPSDDATDSATESTESTDDTDSTDTENAAPAISEAPPAPVVTMPAGPDPESIDVDFATLTARYPDVVGYIYGANTKIQYPIAYTSSTNDYYLNRDLDGNLNANGSIFIEHLNEPDFSDQNTILYGHHMKSGLMFAGLVKYKDPSYYSAHPYFYIYTPTQDYKLNLYAGFVCAHDDEVFATALTQDQLQAMAAKSTFQSNIGTPTGHTVTLCTCSYEFNNARYVIVGELEPIY